MKIFLLLFLIVFSVLFSFAQKDNGREKEDNNLKFAGIPIVSYNRTVDFSAGLMLNAYYKIDLNDTVSPSSSSSLMGIYTTNNSYFGAFVQQLFLKEDKWRLKLVGGIGDANLQFYHEFEQAGQFIDYSTSINILSFDVKRKVYKKFYAGLSASLVTANTIFDIENPITEEKIKDHQLMNNLGINFLYDNRDNINNPTKGLHVFLNDKFFQNWMGNDSNFVQIEFSYNFYFNFKSEKRVMVLRYYSKSSFGKVPFQGQNVIGGDDIRGYSQGKYRDNQIYSYQAEYRHSFENRFGFVVFAGIAAAVPDMLSMLNTQYLPGLGVGLRYMLIKKEKINIGIDIAMGRNDWSLTFRIGEAFSR